MTKTLHRRGPFGGGLRVNSKGAEEAGKAKKKKRCHPEGRQERALSSGLRSLLLLARMGGAREENLP
jgi:hypothetical protein